jgi:hypothetical protein
MDGRTLSVSPRYLNPHCGTGIRSAEKRSRVRGPDCLLYLHLIPWFSRNVCRVPLAETFGCAGSASLSASKHGWLALLIPGWQPPIRIAPTERPGGFAERPGQRLHIVRVSALENKTTSEDFNSKLANKC